MKYVKRLANLFSWEQLKVVSWNFNLGISFSVNSLWSQNNRKGDRENLTQAIISLILQVLEQ